MAQDETPPADPRDDALPEGLDDALEAAFRHKAPATDLPSVLLHLESQGAPAPRLLLRDPSPDDTPVLRPGSSEAPGGRYQTVGEIARGGVGVILKCRDTDLGRDVAMKVLQRRYAGDPLLLERFVEEAQIGGQLQHPGIVPVYELGLTDELQPYFTMKLVKGETLSTLLSDRDHPRAGRRRLLGIFEQVCMTIGYAHSRGVVHRDLKPANVLVGSFGEVMIVDWGFAKVLGHGGVEDERRAKLKHSIPDVTIVQTLRSGSGPESSVGTASVAGSVMGTPSYMPPEQAIGDVDAMSARSDVFALGAILCELLTGKPPYPPGEDSPLAQAAQARLDGAFARLDACGADPALVALAKRCLAPSQGARPADAAVVGRAVAEHLHDVEERARSAQLQAARAAERAQGESNRRRLVMGLAAAVVLAAGAFVWAERQRSDKVAVANRGVARILEEANLLRGREAWDEALARIETARAASGEADAATRGQVEALAGQIRTDRLAALERDARLRHEREFVQRLDELCAAWGEEAQQDERDARFAALLDPLSAADIRTHPAAPTIRLALHLWGRRGDLLEAVDTDPLRAEIRALEPEALLALHGRRAWKQAPVETRVLLAERLGRTGHPSEAAEVHRGVVAEDEDAFFSNLALGWWLTQGPQRDIAEAVGYLLAARAQRPASPAVRYRLARVFADRGDHAAALPHWRRLHREQPDHADVRAHYAASLRAEIERLHGERRYGAADVLLGEAVALEADDAELQYRVAAAHARRGELAEARPRLERFAGSAAHGQEARALLTRIALWEGRLDDVVALMAAALDEEQVAQTLLTRMAWNPDVGVLVALRRKFALDPDDPEAGVAGLRALWSRARGTVNDQTDARMRDAIFGTFAARCLAGVGRHDDAERELASAEQALGAMGASMAAYVRLELAAERGDAAAAAALVARLYQFVPADRELQRIVFDRMRLLLLAPGMEPAARDAAWETLLGRCEQGLRGALEAARGAAGSVNVRNQLTTCGSRLRLVYEVAPDGVRKGLAGRILPLSEEVTQQLVAMVASEHTGPGWDMLALTTYQRVPRDFVSSWWRRHAVLLCAAGRWEEALPIFREHDPLRAWERAEFFDVSWYAECLERGGDAEGARRAAEYVLGWFRMIPWQGRDPAYRPHLAQARGVLERLDAAR